MNTNLFDRAIEYFYQLCEIPHGSGDMDKISRFCTDFAKKQGLKFIIDNARNVIIYKAASKGYEDFEPVILQGHFDMVCQSVEPFDFSNSGITVLKDGDFLTAKGTTLGADNGIAVAMILAILESENISHPAIEAVFTTDEEIGMIGASKLDTSCLKSKLMINLDSEDDGIVTVSCAGGADFITKLPVKRQVKKGTLAKITISGLLGGHSGVEIDKGRVNADILAGRILACFTHEFRIVSINGGNKANAIPNGCVIEVCTENVTELKKQLDAIADEIKEEMHAREEGLSLSFEVLAQGEFSTFTNELTKNIVSALILVPNGIIQMSAEINGLVETSLNLGILKTDEELITMHFALRSNKNSALFFLRKRLERFFESFECTTEWGGYYPPWEYNDLSRLRELYCKTYKEIYGSDPKVEAIHAGLECAVFSSGIKGLDCISIGPQLYDVHTVNESMSMSSTRELMYLLLKILENCKF